MRKQHVIYRHRSVQCPRWQVRILSEEDTPADRTGDTTGQGSVWVAAATLADARRAA